MSAGGARCAMQTHRSRSCSHSPWPGDQFAPVRALVSRILSSRTAPPSPTRRVHRQPRLTDGDCLRSGPIPYGCHALPSLRGRADGCGAFRRAGRADTARPLRHRSIAAASRQRTALPRQELGGRPRAGVAGRANTAGDARAGARGATGIGGKACVDGATKAGGEAYEKGGSPVAVAIARARWDGLPRPAGLRSADLNRPRRCFASARPRYLRSRSPARRNSRSVGYLQRRPLSQPQVHIKLLTTCSV